MEISLFIKGKLNKNREFDKFTTLAGYTSRSGEVRCLRVKGG